MAKFTEGEIMKYLALTICCIFVLLAGCTYDQGKGQVSLVLKGQPSPQRGYNIGRGLFLEKGDIVLATGAVVYWDGTDPNDLFGE